MPSSSHERLWGRADQKPPQGSLLTQSLTAPCLPKAQLKAINFYLQNGVQLVILYAYPKVPKQKDAPKQRKQAIKVPFDPSP